MPFIPQLPDWLAPHVWSGQDLGRQDECVPTGHPALDAHLPGGGWPRGNLVEILQPQVRGAFWHLLLPALSQWVLRHPGPVVLVGAPLEPFTPSLQAHGLPAERLLWIRTPASARLWAAEQAVRCADVAAVLAWLPQVRPAELRRLQLPAHRHGQLLFVFRGLQAAAQPSPARLRLKLLAGGDQTEVHLFKRRGPPAEAPVILPAQPSQLRNLLAARKGRPVPVPHLDASHVLDRMVPTS